MTQSGRAVCASMMISELAAAKADDDDRVLSMHISCPEQPGHGRFAPLEWLVGTLDNARRELTGRRGELSTGCLELRLSKPVPVDHDLVLSSWLDGREGHWQFISSEIRLATDGTLLASCWTSVELAVASVTG